MGALHARTVHACQETRLVGVVDHHLARAQQLADRFGCEPQRVDAALYIVATPAHAHLEVGRPLLDAGHVLFEKPAGIGWSDALEHPRALVAFSERYHPGWLGLRVRTRFEAIRERVSRASDVDALDDLLIHDLDLLDLHTRGAAIEHVERDGSATCVHLGFDGGTATIRVDGSHAGRVEHRVDGRELARAHLHPDPLTRQLRAVLDQMRTGRGVHRADRTRRLKRWIEEIRCASS